MSANAERNSENQTERSPAKYNFVPHLYRQIGAVASARVDMPSVSSEEWFPTPSVIDCTETESHLEWRELLELRATGAHIDRARLKAALLHGIPPALRPQAWLSFSGCTEWMRRHPMVYDQLCTRVARGGSAAPDVGVQDQIEKDLRRTEAGTSGDQLEACSP